MPVIAKLRLAAHPQICLQHSKKRQVVNKKLLKLIHKLFSGNVSAEGKQEKDGRNSRRKRHRKEVRADSRRLLRMEI